MQRPSLVRRLFLLVCTRVLALTSCMGVDVELPEDVAIQQKLAGKKTFSAALFKSSDDEAAEQLRQEVENQPDWWNSDDGKLPRICVGTQLHNYYCKGFQLSLRARWGRALIVASVQGRSLNLSTTPKLEH